MYVCLSLGMCVPKGNLNRFPWQAQRKFRSNSPNWKNADGLLCSHRFVVGFEGTGPFHYSNLECKTGLANVSPGMTYSQMASTTLPGRAKP